MLGVVDQDLEHEAVDLGLRQRIRALRLDRVLRRQHEEGLGHRVRRVRDRHLPLLHHLEQRRLHLRGSAVDLVGEQEVAEDRAELGVELALVGPVDARADEVGRHEVGRELHARERAAEHAGRRLDRQRLREPGDALDQQVPLREQADEHALEHRVLPGDDPADLEERLLELVAHLSGRARRRAARRSRTLAPPRSWTQIILGIRKSAMSRIFRCGRALRHRRRDVTLRLVKPILEVALCLFRSCGCIGFMWATMLRVCSDAFTSSGNHVTLGNRGRLKTWLPLLALHDQDQLAERRVVDRSSVPCTVRPIFGIRLPISLDCSPYVRGDDLGVVVPIGAVCRDEVSVDEFAD